MVKQRDSTEIAYLELPSGTYCYDGYDEASGQCGPLSEEIWECVSRNDLVKSSDVQFEFVVLRMSKLDSQQGGMWRWPSSRKSPMVWITPLNLHSQTPSGHHLQWTMPLVWHMGGLLPTCWIFLDLFGVAVLSNSGDVHHHCVVRVVRAAYMSK